MQGVSVAANHHKKNAQAERASRTIRSYYGQLLSHEPQSTLVGVATAAAFYKNVCQEHKNLSF